MEPYPLIFQPLYKPKVWGGRRLESVVGKRLPPNQPIGESWELADLESDQSIVANGPAAGTTLAGMSSLWGPSLTGRAELVHGRFPILIKFLDATETLSVQVHPDAEAARFLGRGAEPKDEAWYVIDAVPGAILYRGLLPGVGADELSRAMSNGRIESVLCQIPAKKGHCYYSPAGTIHAVGAGLLLAEVQTPSDTTYRLHDWNRIDPAIGRPRELHRDAALSCIRFDPIPASAEHPEHLGSVWTSVTRLVRCEFFVIERVRMVEGVVQEIHHQEMVIWIVLEGHGSIRHKGSASPTVFGLGDTVLIPAGLKQGHVQAHSRCMWLEVTVPIPSSLAAYGRPGPESLGSSPGGAERWVSLGLPPKP